MEEKVVEAVAVEDPIYAVPYWRGVLHLRQSDVACAILNIQSRWCWLSIESRSGETLCTHMANLEQEEKVRELRESLVKLATNPEQFKLSDVSQREYEDAKLMLRPWTFRQHVVSSAITHENFITFKRSKASCSSGGKLTIKLKHADDLVLDGSVWDLDAVELSLHRWVMKVDTT